MVSADGRERREQLRTIFLLLAGIIFVGTLGYQVVEGWPWFDSLYMTVITLATIGYGETRPLSDAGRTFTIVLILMGVSVVAYVFSMLNTLVFDRWLWDQRWRSRVQSRIEKLTGHFIVCGCGRMGSLVRKELEHAQVPFVVIEKDADVVRRLAGEGVLVIEGDATEEAALERAGISRAAALAAALSADADNLFVTMTARGLNSALTIVSRASSDAVERKLVQAGANRVISPNVIGGRLMADALLIPDVIDFLQLAMGRAHRTLQVGQIQASSGSVLVSRRTAVGDMRPRHQVTVLALRKRDGKVFEMPASESIIEEGDSLIVVGRPDECQRLAAGARQ